MSLLVVGGWWLVVGGWWALCVVVVQCGARVLCVVVAVVGSRDREMRGEKCPTRPSSARMTKQERRRKKRKKNPRELGLVAAPNARRAVCKRSPLFLHTSKNKIYSGNSPRATERKGKSWRPLRPRTLWFSPLIPHHFHATCHFPPTHKHKQALCPLSHRHWHSRPCGYPTLVSS